MTTCTNISLWCHLLLQSSTRVIFFLPLVKGVTRFIAAIQLLKMKCPKLHKNTSERTRAGQDQGGPRWDTLTKKSKSTKLLQIVLCYTQGVVAYDPVLFGGCIPPPLTPLQVKPEALILISIGGRTLQFGVMCIFMFLCIPKLTFITYCGIGKSKGL